MNKDEELRRQAEKMERRDWKVLLRTKVWEALSGPQESLNLRTDSILTTTTT